MMHSISMRLHLIVRKNPLLLISVILLLLSLSTYFIVNERLNRELGERQQQIASVNTELIANSKPSVASDMANLQAQFYDDIGYISHVDEPLKLMLELAKEAGVVVGQSQFRYRSMPSTKLIAYDITAPVKGTYPAIRRFCEHFLLAVPFASLSELNLKRDSTQQTQIEGKLRLTLYLHSQPIKPLKQQD